MKYVMVVFPGKITFFCNLFLVSLLLVYGFLCVFLHCHRYHKLPKTFSNFYHGTNVGLNTI